MRGRLRFGGVSVIVTALLVALPAQAEAATTSALWSMENTATMVDSSGNGNNGTVAAITGVPGSPGQGYRFNGTSSMVTVPDAPELDPGTSTLTVTAKVKFTVVPNSAVGDYDLVRKGLSSTSGGEYKMEILPNSAHTAGSAFCLFKDGNKKVASIRDSRNIADGAWHTISCTKTSTSVQVVVDGATKSAKATLGSISNSAGVTVGAKPGGGDQYRGDMDEVSIKRG